MPLTSNRRVEGGYLRREIHVYQRVHGSFMPKLVRGMSTTGDQQGFDIRFEWGEHDVILASELLEVTIPHESSH